MVFAGVVAILVLIVLAVFLRRFVAPAHHSIPAGGIAHMPDGELSEPRSLRHQPASPHDDAYLRGIDTDDRSRRPRTPVEADIGRPSGQPARPVPPPAPVQFPEPPPDRLPAESHLSAPSAPEKAAAPLDPLPSSQRDSIVIDPASCEAAPADIGLCNEDEAPEGVQVFGPHPASATETPAPEPIESSAGDAAEGTDHQDRDPSKADATLREESPSASVEKGRVPRKPAVHRDRRGTRRQPAAKRPAPPTAPTAFQVRPPADLGLRLGLHPIRRTVTLYLVMSRPEGLPDQTTIILDDHITVAAYDQTRYDDVNLPWNSAVLAGELRLESTDGLQWLRSARRVHIFAADANQPELVSVPAARLGIDHAIICRTADIPAVRTIAESAGSPELVSHDHWQGIPEGWSVLSGYVPTRSAQSAVGIEFRPLDPGVDREIVLAGGLALRKSVFAEGYPPRIEINPFPENASVTIGGVPASLNQSGAWEAAGWDHPGRHTVDIVPGPSLTYEIAADPAHGPGWSHWDAHENRSSDAAPWSRTVICGAMVVGSAGEVVLAEETLPTLIVLGASRGATTLQQRTDAGVSVALLSEPPAFLFATTGQRRSQGRVIWLGLTGSSPSVPGVRHSDKAWVSVIRTAASRRLPLHEADAIGKNAWHKAVTMARKLKGRHS